MSSTITMFKICRQKFYHRKDVILIDTKEFIIEKFYNEHKKPSIIAKELSVNPSYVTKIIKKDIRYDKEKEYRAGLSKENHKASKRAWIRNKRNAEYDKQINQVVKAQHIKDVKHLSKTSELSNSAFVKWNRSIYRRNKDNDLVAIKNIKLTYDVPRKICMKAYLSPQKFKKNYFGCI